VEEREVKGVEKDKPTLQNYLNIENKNEMRNTNENGKIIEGKLIYYRENKSFTSSSHINRKRSEGKVHLSIFTAPHVSTVTHPQDRTQGGLSLSANRKSQSLRLSIIRVKGRRIIRVATVLYAGEKNMYKSQIFKSTYEYFPVVIVRLFSIQDEQSIYREQILKITDEYFPAVTVKFFYAGRTEYIQRANT